MSEPLIRITRGLHDSNTVFEEVALSKVATYLKRFKDCYEMTNPTAADPEAVMNRVYVDLDGVAGDMSEEDFADLCETITMTIKTRFECPVCIMESNQYQLPVIADDGSESFKNKLSYRIHFIKQHGTKRAVKEYVLHAIPLFKALLDGIVSITDDPEVFPRLNIDDSVYAKGRKMRMLGSSKDYKKPFVRKEDRPLRFCDPSYTVEDSLITLIPEDSVCLPEPEAVVAYTPPPKLKIEADPVMPENSVASEADAELELLTRVILGLDVKRVNAYDSWLRIGLICFNEGIGIEAWIEVSKKSPHFNLGELTDKWKTFKKGNLTQATLWKWLKEDNPVLAAELMPERNDFWSLLRCVNHAEVARYFYNLKPDAYLFNEDLKWFQLMPTGTWKHYEKSPSGLLTDIWATLKKVIKEHWEINGSPPHDEKQEKRAKSLNSFSQMIGNKSFLDGVVGLLPTNYNDDNLSKKMDESRHLFAFENKVVDLSQTPPLVRDILPSDYISLNTGYKFPSASNPEVRAEINAVLMSIWEDEFVVEYVLRVIAVQLHGKKKFEQFYVWTGRGGNGKGLIAEIIKRSFGNYFHSIPHDCITKRSDKRDAPNPPIAMAKGKRFVQAQEPEAEDRLQVGTIKEYTGQDEISARMLYGNTITYVPQFGLFLQCNTIPKLNKLDGGIKRRMVIIFFPFQFVEVPKEKHHRPINHDLKDKICKSAEWRDEFMLMLLETYQTIGASLNPPAFITLATDDYLGENDAIRDWLPSNYETGKDYKDKRFKIPALELIRHFQEDNPDVKDMTPAKFKTLMEMNGIPQERVSNNFKAEQWNHYDGKWEDKVERKAGSYYLGLQRKMCDAEGDVIEHEE